MATFPPPQATGTQRNGPEGHRAKACFPYFRTPWRSEGRGSGGCEGLPGPSALWAPAPTAQLEGILWLCGSGCPGWLGSRGSQKKAILHVFLRAGILQGFPEWWVGRGQEVMAVLRVTEG